MEIVVKNVPRHAGGEFDEDLICSLSDDVDDKLDEHGHINDNGDRGCCTESKDTKGDVYQHRVFCIGNKTEPPQHIYMWVTNIEVDTFRELTLDLKPFLNKYPMYIYDVQPQMGRTL